MISFLLSILFSKILTLGGPVLCLGAAFALAWFGFKDLARIALIVAGVWFATGLMYREGYKQASMEWQARSDAELARQRQEAENVRIQSAADAARAARHAAELETQLEELRIFLETSDTSQPEPAPAPVNGKCPPVRQTCTLSTEERKRLESIR